MPSELLAISTDIFAWYNAVFAGCFAVGLFFTALQVLGLGQTDTDVDVDTDVDADADVDTDTDADTDIHHGHADSVGATQAVAQFFGLGRVPISAILMTLFYTVGITGWMAAAILAPRYASERSLFLTSLAIALVVGLVIMRLVTGLLAKYMPAVLTSALREPQLVGLTGEAKLPINERFGRVMIKDQYGTLHTVNCKVPPGVEPIAKGARIVLTKYLATEHMFYACRAR
ncbi:MAG: DUF1449 family protein [Phycisphaerae bacterium]|nr:DUF1449 family protein [Phycisphaerae bacterium]